MTSVLGRPGSPTRQVATPATAPRSWRRVRLVARRLGTEAFLIVALAVVAYAVAAVLVDFRFEIYPPDAVYRMANGFYVLYSRHFHLGAIGFVWNPLTSVADMVPLLFKDLWHPLVSRDVAASIVTVAAMAGAVHQTRSMLEEWGIARAPRLVLTALLALNPMIVYYAANGMSEALYVFTTVGTVRYLRRWLVDDDSKSLVYAALMLALCYLAREEAVAIALTSGLVVLIVSSRRGGGRRLVEGLSDAVIYLFPFLACFVGWALASLVITGSAFAQFTSQYGNTAQLQEYGSSYHLLPGHYLTRLAHEARALEAMAPLLPVLLVVSIVVALRRRDRQVLAPLAVLGGGLLFTVVGYLDNLVFPWFRFYILCAPLEVLLVASIVAPGARREGQNAVDAVRARRARRGIGAVLACGAAVVCIGPSLATTAQAMDNPKIGIEESTQLAEVFHPALYHHPPSDGALIPILPYLEGLHLQNGDVLTDDAFDCMATAIVRSSNPKIFVITNDSDFAKILADPLTWQTHYVVVPQPSRLYNAVDAAYPDLYRNGAGFSKLVRSFPPTGLCPPLRLYKVTAHTSQP